MITVQVLGKQAFRKAMRGVGSEVKKEIDLLIDEAALEIHSTAVQSIYAGGKSGRIYKGGRGGKIHQASAPGQAPANDRGHLGSSIRVASLKSQKPEQPAMVASNAKYSRPLEEGTRGRRGHGRIKPRPFMKPAFDKAIPKLRSKLSETVKRGMKKGKDKGGPPSKGGK